MENKLKMIFLIAGAVLLTSNLVAQSRLTEEEKQEAIERYLAFQEELSLTEEQEPLVEEINMEFFEGLSQLRQSNASKLDKYRTYKDLSTKRNQQMKQVLNSEQYQLFKEFQAETKENFKERRKSR